MSNGEPEPIHDLEPLNQYSFEFAVECTPQQAEDLMVSILNFVETKKIKIGGGYCHSHDDEAEDGEEPG